MDKVVLVTGGGRGIGRATCLLAAERGYRLVVNYASNAATAEAVKKDIEAKGGKALAVKADVSNEADVVAMFKEADKLGPLWGLVNSGGIVLPDHRIDQTNVADLQRIFAVNAVGPFITMREAILRMSSRHGGAGGSIVNISSMNSVLGAGGRAVSYAATKGALDSLTIGASRELAKEGVRVNTVRPGPIDTDILDLKNNPARAESIKTLVPMGRVGQPIEAANAVLWFLSDESSFVTGTILNVSGGR